MLNILLGIFFIVHGLIHLAFVAPTPPAKDGAAVYPFNFSHSWLGLSPEILKGLGIFLTIVAAVGFVTLGLGVLGWLVPDAWLKMIAIIAAAASLLLMVFFWNNMFIVGFALSLATLIWFIR
jgi:hypothetical protein